MTVSTINILLFGISGGEIMVIILLVIMLFGPKKIPEIARMMGRGITEFRRVQREINTEINRFSNEVETQTRNMQSEIDGMVGKGAPPAEVPVKKPAEIPEETQSTHEKPAQEEIKDSQPDENDELPYPYNQKTGDS
ncbi:MAG: twin-arginine translocase TatA/TatE family subunit [Bacteroidales bacterium]